jgi:hypothetical protein
MLNWLVVICLVATFAIAGAMLCRSLFELVPTSEASAGAQAEAEEHAEQYLRRVIALTGATQMGRPYCILDVGNTRFEVHDSYVSRTAIGSNSRETTKAARGTCFYIPNERMPVSEKIATALLQLKNNPGLFEKWAAQTGAFKADGEQLADVRGGPAQPASGPDSAFSSQSSTSSRP